MNLIEFTKKNINKKKIAFGILSAIFFIILIWALLAANGRKINLSDLFTRRPEVGVIQTGGIRITNDDLVNQMHAKLDGNDVEIKENRIENIEPGIHELEIVLDGFDIWSRSIRVDPGVINEVYPLLFPSQFNLEERIDGNLNVDKVFYSSYGDYVYYVVTKAPKGIDNGIFRLQLSKIESIFNTNNDSPVKIANLVSPIKEHIDAGNYQLLPSPDNRKIMLTSEGMDHLIFDIDQPLLVPEYNKYVSVEELLGYTPQEVSWLKGSSSLIIKHETLLAELVIDSGKIVLISYEPNISPVYSVNGDSLIYYSHSNQHLYLYKNENKQEIVLENRTLPTEISKIFVDTNTGNYLVLQSAEDFFFVSLPDSYVSEIDSNINPLEFSKDGTCLIYEKEGNLYSYITKEIKVKNDFEIKKNLIIESYDKENTDIRLNSNASHILIFNNNSLIVKDLTGENSKVILESENLIRNSYFMTSDNREMVLLMLVQAGLNSSEETKVLYTINLVPSQPE